MTPTPQEAMRQEFEASDLSAFRQGNWPHPDGIGRIVGWIIPNEAVERMGADAYCLPREIDEALTQLAALRAQPEAVQDEWLEKAMELAAQYVESEMHEIVQRREALRAHLSAGGRRTLHFRDAYQAALAAAPSKE